MKIQHSRERSLEFFIPLFITVTSTILLFFTDLDLTVSSLFFNPIDGQWFLATHPLILFIYYFGQLIPSSIFLISLIILSLSYVLPKFFKFRAITCFIVLSVMIMPLFVTHVVIKETWKRPRPRDTIEFGGNHEFRKVLVIADHDFRGRSFPAGHSAAGFILVFFYFLLKKRHRKWANLSLLLALLFGIWLSISRIAMGGHYLSDTIWAFTLCWFTVYLLYYKWFLKYESKLQSLKPFTFSKARILTLLAVVSLLASSITAGVLIMKPYEEELVKHPIDLPVNVPNVRIRVRVQKGNIHLIRQERTDIMIETWATGMGPEGIRVTREIDATIDGDTFSIQLATKPSSWYWSYQSHSKVFVPKDLEVDWDVKTELGTIFRYNSK